MGHHLKLSCLWLLVLQAQALLLPPQRLTLGGASVHALPDEVKTKVRFTGTVESLAPPGQEVYLLHNFLSSSDCTELIALSNEQQAASFASEQPKASFDSRKLLLLVPLVLAAALAQTSLQAHTGATGASNFLGNLAVDSLMVLGVGGALALLVPTLNWRSSRVTPLAISSRECAAASIVRRACALLECDAAVLERPALTHYSQGQQFKSHHDASRDLEGDGWNALGGQRIATLILYLNDVPTGRGGCTVFDSLGVSVRPQRGAALLFYPAADDERGSLHEGMLHHAEAPEGEGSEKYVVQVWRRQRQVPSPLGLTPEEISLIC